MRSEPNQRSISRSSLELSEAQGLGGISRRNRMRPWFPDEASALGVQGDGCHTWDVLPLGSAACCWVHKPDSCAYTWPLKTCTLSSSTGHSALASILQGELWAGVSGVPSSAKVTGGSELRLLPALPGLLLTLRSVCLASAVSDGHGRPARGLLVCLPLERGEDPGVRGGQRRPQLQSIFCNAQLRACALSSVPSQEIFKYIAYL